MDFVKKIEKYIIEENLIKKGDKVLVGVSGGADSVCLLLILHELKNIFNIDLNVIHINHKIRIDASDDAEYVRNLCENLEIPFFLEEVDIPKISQDLKLGEEEAARNLRYQKIAETAQKINADKIAIAHHMDDQAETLILNLARGSGLRGLAGIKSKRDKIIRPLLCVEKCEIEEFLADKNIKYQTDSTNLEDDHTRNRIRHHVLPYLSGNINAKSIEHIADAAALIQEASNYLEKVSKEKLDTMTSKNGDRIELDIKALSKEEDIIKKYILMELLNEVTFFRKDITKEHFEALLLLCKKTDGTSFLSLPYGIKAVREYDKLFFLNENTKNNLLKEPKKFTEKKDLEIENLTDLKVDYESKIIRTNGKNIEELLAKVPHSTYTKWVDYDKIQTALCFRTRRIGDKITIDDYRHKKSLKKLFIDEKIPKTDRDGKLLIADGNEIVWIPNVRLNSMYKISKDTKTILEISINL